MKWSRSCGGIGLCIWGVFCSVEVESLLAEGGDESLLHDLLGGVVGQFEVMDTSVHTGIHALVS